MQDRHPTKKQGTIRKGIKVTDVSENAELLKRIRSKKSSSFVKLVPILLAFLFFSVGAYGQGSQWEISANLDGGIATLESIGSANDVFLFKIDMSEASVLVSYKGPEGQQFGATLKLIRIVEFRDDYGVHEIVDITQIAGSAYSAETYDLVLAEVDGKGVEVTWSLGTDSSLKLNLELFLEDAIYEHVVYGPTKARMRLNLNYPMEGEDSEISLEAEILSVHADLSWSDEDNFQEVSASLPISSITFGFSREIIRDEKTKKVSFSHEEIERGVAFVADYGGTENMSWLGYCTVDIRPLEEEWHPIGDPIVFGGAVVASGVVVILLKMRYLKLGGGLTG
ncbi:MAG: hypothetical protein ACE5IO_09565 [Thermoplasmata archaeon]